MINVVFMIRQLIIILFLTASALAGQIGQYTVHYSVRGDGHDIIISAESSSEARRTVERLIPDPWSPEPGGPDKTKLSRLQLTN